MFTLKTQKIRYLLLIAGVLLLLLGFLFSPTFVENTLSSDGSLSDQNIDRINLVKVISIVVGLILILNGSILLNLKEGSYWLVVTLVLLTLIYSTSLSFFFAPEQTISTHFFNSERSHSLKEHYPELGEYSTFPSFDQNPGEVWKFSNFWGDIGYYLVQSKNVTKSIAPYKYRVLPTFIAFNIHRLTKLKLPFSYLLMNILLVYLIGIIFTYFCKRSFQFTNLLSLFGGVLAITTVGLTRTLPFPMLEPATYFFFLLTIVALKTKNDYLYVFSAICGVLSKEVLVVVGILYLLNNYLTATKKNITSFLIKVVPLSLLPFLAFAGVRLGLGGAALEVNYGFNILKGEFPTYGKRLLSIMGVLQLTIRVFLSFSLLWFGLLNATKDKFIYKNILFAIPLIVLPTILLSGRIARVIGVLFPLIIIPFLFFLSEKYSNKLEQEN